MKFKLNWKMLSVLLMAIGVSVTAFSNNQFKEKLASSFDFIAPIVLSMSSDHDQVGLIVYDSNANQFKGRGTGSEPIILGGNGASVPSGTIMAYGGTTAPEGYLICDGSEVSRTTYGSLFSAIGTNFGSGNGSTTFHLPDLRGMFLRGHDDSAGNDPDAASRTANNTGGNTGDTVGSQQADEVGPHNHSFSSGDLFIYENASGGSPYMKWSNSTGGGFNDLSFGANSTGPTSDGDESRPINVSVTYIIKI